MKKYLFLTAAALVLSLSLAGCSGKADPEATDGTAADTAVTVNPEDAAAPEVTMNALLDGVDGDFTDIDKTIDMDKVDGTDAKTADDEYASGTVNGADVKITDAKIINYNDSDVIVVSFDFKNRTDRELAFTGILSVEAEQGDSYIPPMPVSGVEGIACETLAQMVKGGERITVQQAFRLRDAETPVTITVLSAAAPDYNESVSKTFNIQ